MGWIIFIIVSIAIVILIAAVASSDKEKREKRLAEISTKLEQVKPFNSEYRVYDFAVKGLTYRSSDVWDRARHLIRHEPLLLIAEPNNSFDKNAVKVITSDGIDIGYVDAKYSYEVSRCLKEYTNYRCYVSKVNYSLVSYVYALAAFYPENF